MFFIRFLMLRFFKPQREQAKKLPKPVLGVHYC
jgi:hypothetical protein